MKLELYNNGIRMRFGLLELVDWQYIALFNCLSKNKELGNLDISEVRLDQTNQFTFIITKILGNVPELVQLIEVEILREIRRVRVYTNIPESC